MTIAQQKLPGVTHPGSFGIKASETNKALEVDVFKELVNKIAWALGTCYVRPYANMKCEARQIALELATAVVVKQGWPTRIRRS